MPNARFVSTLRCALAALSLGLGGCAVDPDADLGDDPTGDNQQVASALSVSGPGTLEVSPTMVCSSTTADATLAVTPSWQSVAGVSVDAGACQWRVTELTGTYGRKVDVVVNSFLAAPGVTQARCAESVSQDVVYGYVPGFYRRAANNGLLWVEGRWEQVDSHTQHGTWIQGGCHFTHHEQNSTLGQTGHTVVVRAPYTVIRVATRRKLVQPDGTVVRGTLTTSARTLPLLPGE